MNFARLLAAAAVVLVSAGAAGAEEFNGTGPLICASVDTLSCAPGTACIAATTDELNVPQFFRINFTEKRISATRPDGEERVSEIQSLKQQKDELILQGTQGGLGWSMTIAGASGKMSLSAVGDQVAFVIFGACTAFPKF